MLVAFHSSDRRQFDHGLYHLEVFPNHVTIIDSQDQRARKSVPFDLFSHYNKEIFYGITQPLLHILSSPKKAKQATMVIDGQRSSTSNLVFGEDGIFPLSCRWLIQAHSALEVSAIALTSSCCFQDVLQKKHDTTAVLPTIMEQVDDRTTFTTGCIKVKLSSISDIEELNMDLRRNWNNEDQSDASPASCIVTLSFLLCQDGHCTKRDLNFVILSVPNNGEQNVLYRHDIETVIYQVANRQQTVNWNSSPHVKFLKPYFLAQQPGAWVACFGLLKGQGSETFKAALNRLTLANGVYSSRVILEESLHDEKKLKERISLRREAVQSFENEKSGTNCNRVLKPSSSPSTLNYKPDSEFVSALRRKNDFYYSEEINGEQPCCRCAADLLEYKKSVQKSMSALRDDIYCYALELKNTKEKLKKKEEEAKKYRVEAERAYSKLNEYEREVQRGSVLSFLNPRLIAPVKGCCTYSFEEKKDATPRELAPYTSRCGWSEITNCTYDEYLELEPMYRLKSNLSFH